MYCNVTWDQLRNHTDRVKSLGNGPTEIAAGNTADKTAWELEISSSNTELLHHDNYRKSFACLER